MDDALWRQRRELSEEDRREEAKLISRQLLARRVDAELLNDRLSDQQFADKELACYKAGPTPRIFVYSSFFVFI